MEQNNKKMQAHSDRFLSYIGKIAEDEMLKECDQWEKAMKKLKIPKKLESQILMTAGTDSRDRRKQKISYRIRRYMKTAATVVLIVTLAFAMLVVSVEALRNEVFNLIFQSNDAYTKVIPVETITPGRDVVEKLPSDWKDVYYPAYLPEDYEFVEAETASSAKTLAFQNEAADVLLLTQEPWDEAEILIDTQSTDSGETFIHGSDAFWTSKNGETTLMWSQYGTMFMLYGPVDLDEIIKVAENLLLVQ